MVTKLYFSFALIVVMSTIPAIAFADEQLQDPIKIGWIGAMTGAHAKWGMYNATKIAEEEINGAGGIQGRLIKVVYEDAKGDGKLAVSAFQKLKSFDAVSYILGGHCSPESLSFAPLAQKSKIIMMASITSNPKLTYAGDYVFRVTTVSTKQADMLVDYFIDLQKKTFALLYETTDYVEPIAKKFREVYEKKGGTAIIDLAFNTGESDFKTLLTKIKSSNPEVVFLGAQTPDTGAIMMRQLHELGIQAMVTGNDVLGASFEISNQEVKQLFEGAIFAQIVCDQQRVPTKEFSEKFRVRTGLQNLPFGCYTAEPYDSLKIIAKIIEKCQQNVECAKTELLQMKNYPGASGDITFDENGDVDKPYQLRVIRGQKIIVP